MVLIVQFPYGYYHPDPTDLLHTPYQWIHKNEFDVHGKKTIWPSLAISVPVALRVPVLIAFPIVQHALGLVLVALSGILVSCWFRKWNWFLVPVTLLVAANHAILWYEHTPMAEFICLLSLVLAALAGTLHCLRPGVLTFAFLGAALVFTAGSRPEGKFFSCFGLLLVMLVHWREWRSSAPS